VSTSGFYDWSTRQTAEATERQVAEAELVEMMRDIFDASDGNYGVPRMHRELRRAHVIVNEKPVRRLMRLHGRAVPAPPLPEHVPRLRRVPDP
jgi:putative transposase